MKFCLTDTTLKAYTKKSGQIAIHLNTYLIVYTKLRISLTAYMKELSAELDIENIGIINNEGYQITINSFYDNPDLLVHQVHMVFLLPKNTQLYDTTAILRTTLHVSPTNHPSEKSETIVNNVIINYIK